MVDVVTLPMDWVIVLPVVLGLVGAAVLLMLRSTLNAQPVFAALVVVAIAVCDGQLLMRVLAEGPVTMTMGRWAPPFGISFTADILGASLALAAAVVTLVVLAYARLELGDAEQKRGFYPLVLLLLTGVSGAFLTGDLFNLYVWFEVLLIASFGLMVLTGRKDVLDGAVKYGVLNFLGTTFFLVALGYTYGLLGTLNMADIAFRVSLAPQGPLLAIAALLLLAFGVKAAAFPVNAWLPASYHTPPVAISALFAGLLTKVGVYALLRTLGMMLPQSRDLLEPVLSVIAGLTMLIAPLGAIAETNLRRALGFLVIGGIGAALMGLALAGESGLAGAAVYTLFALLNMTAFYLVAGLVERATGASDTREMGGLYARHSLLAILFAVSVFLTAGTPPLLGFWPKLLLVEAGLGLDGDPGWIGYGLTAALLLNALLTLIAGSRLWAHIFWRPGRYGANSELPNERVHLFDRREIWLGVVPVGALTVLMVIIGLAPGLLLGGAQTAARDLVDPTRYIVSTGVEARP